MRVLVAGYRKWRDEATIRARLSDLPPDTVILHGDASDPEEWLATLVADLAQELDLAHEPVPIAPDALLAADVGLLVVFHGYLANSRSSKALVEEAERRGIPVEVWPRRVA